MSILRAYLGKAIALPVRLLKGAGVVVSGLTPLQQSIVSILTTPIGSRFMLREYGSRYDELIFEQNDTVLAALLHTYAIEALSRWETRAQFFDTEVVFPKDKPTEVQVRIFYRVLPSNEIDSFVFPFYKSIKH